MIRFLEIQGLNCRETLLRPLPKATLVCKKKKRNKNPKEKAHLHQRNQVFPISIMETLLNLVLLASL
jgi:hypothetical protein